MPGGRPALHSVSSHDQYGTETLKHDPEPADRYDCVNKPLYQCEEKVSRPNTKCSICVVGTVERSVFDIHSDCLFAEAQK